MIFTILVLATARLATAVPSPAAANFFATPVALSPLASTPYLLAAGTPVPSKAGAATVKAAARPVITSFTASPAMLTAGQQTTLSWVATGATSLRIDPGVGAVTGTSVKVTPAATTTYTLTATNAGGAVSSTATITVGKPPVIASFAASPAKMAPGQSTVLTWAVTSSNTPGLMLNPGVGPVTGTSVKVTPKTTTTYTLSATNPFGTVSATTTVAVGNPPVINQFSVNPNIAAGPGVSAILLWNTTGATILSVDHGVGAVTGDAGTVKVGPTAATTYTLTATNAVGSVTATAKVPYIPLTKVSNQVYYSEHAVFIVPNSGQVAWPSWDSVYSTANVNSYVATLKSVFPSDYFFVVVAANNLTPNNVPSVMDYRHVADGIGANSITGVGVPNICRYNIGGGTVIDGAFGVLDHEIGHNWGVFVGLELGNPHWLSNSTITGQMAALFSDDGYVTDKRIAGDPIHGFTWTATANLAINESDTFSLHDLYLQGLNPTFPDAYVLTSPVYKADHTMGYSSVAKYDNAWMVKKNGARNPTYRTSDKRFRVGVVYIARDAAEILASYQPIERSITHFANAEQIDKTTYRFQVPFLVDTQYRASINALLADLDGNRTPTLSIDGSAYVTTSSGSAVVPFKAADPDGPLPAVSCVPASINCGISGTNVVLTGLTPGTHFFTIKAQDTGGKKTFAHFVVDQQ